MTSQIDKTIARQQEKIAAGAYYESHQQLRVIAARYLKQSNYDAAAELLAGGAIALLKAGAQQGASASGGDLAIMLVVDVYNKAEWELSDDEVGNKRRQRLIDILQEFPPEEPTRKRYINEMIAWSAKFGYIETGDPEMHHAVGSIYAEENEVYDAERHLALGTADSAEILARLEYTWYTHDAVHTAGIYAARAVFPYLLTGSFRNANKAFLIFRNQLSSSPTSHALNVQEVSSQSNDVRVYPSLPLLNFTSLLLLAIQRGNADSFKQLLRHYATYIQEAGEWDQALAHIGEVYFGIRIPKQSNPLMDMMGMFFGGGPQGGNRSKTPQRSKAAKQVDAPPVSMDLD
ncbi:hypothetical protein D8B26_000769 [Coccidioides posadasii str. Silveira]|uniref:Uncharacterized protein n=3 Tax=Coccidioides posadasii TaxID=199306 RepID=E9CSA5_COCPS|nr:hypothetical protein CPC735_037310 [Coccidioides posadasii C735 delta SOWgp]EER29025.1 hypothetical protein CPC735_037310 [Coccidioides posadasii C735 delta SOWgp]EFW22574.1 hypothetical protein CPSG_00473 [Coccidioides posadasii str. Silveira]QVM06055.1 hypothetical protein D8B26_000769 [Coccidioides posadasii str. Silveira]|eukprot:XP_003071170.1 hypothetical protein CPC735_037310 [Coccidioides posadasii C735 delta SOWgp]